MRRWAFRAATVLAALVPFVVLELALRAFQFPEVSLRADPLVDLHALRPLFTPSADGQRLEIGAERRNWFDHDAFSKVKPQNGLRVFALGGSTVQGEPYHKESSFPTFLKLYLATAMPDRTIEVVNCGGLSYASYRVSAILDEVLNYEPDLIIVYCGHNEFLEQRTYANWHRIPLPIAHCIDHLSDLQLVRAGRYLLHGDAPVGSATTLSREVDTQLDHEEGYSSYHRDVAWRSAVLAHYQATMRRMIEKTRAANVPLIVCIPVSNLRDTPPFKVEPSPELPPSAKNCFDELWNAIQSDSISSTDRASLCREALSLDPHHAGAAFILGRTLLEQNEIEAARRHLQIACDWDVCPLRMPSEIRDYLQNLVQETNTPSVDATELFSSLSRNGIVGNDWLVDHVHPSIPGHQRLGEALYSVAATILKIHRPSDFDERIETAIKAHYASLDETYYQHGLQRLEGLQKWATGRAKKLHTQ